MHPLSKAIITLGISALAFTPQAAFAAEWVLAGEGGTSKTKIYVDVTSIKRTGLIITYWTRTEYVNDKRGWKRDLSLIEANCTTGQKRDLQTAVYYENGTSDSSSSPSRWRYVVPDSVGKMELDLACSNI